MSFPSGGFSGIATRDLGPSWYAVMGIDRDTGPVYRTPSEFARAPADEAWVYSCIRRLYQAAQGVPLRVYIRAGNDLIPAVNEPSPEGDDLQYLLDYVNPVDMTGADLKAYTVASYAVWGECYWRKVRGRFGGPPQELYWLRAADVEVPSVNGRTPTAFVHRPAQGVAETYKPRDIVPFRTPNLANPLRGLSPLSSIGNEIATGRGWAERQNSVLQNDSVPPGFWQIPKDAEFSKQDEGLVKRALRSLRGPRAKGKVPIMPVGLDFKPIALTPQQAEMIAGRKVSRMAICAALGVPLVLAGDDDKNTVYGNLREAERILYRGTVIPLLDGYADVLNNWLVPDFDPTRRRLVVAFDYTEIEALQPTWDVRWNAWLSAVSSQVVVPNEFRRKFRLGDDVPWGNRPVPKTQITMRPAPEILGTDAIPALDPAANEIDLPDEASIYDEVAENPTDIPVTLRAYGKALYKHPAVRAWTAAPTDQLDTSALFGRPIPTDQRQLIEAGLRRRDSAAAIAAALEVPAG